MATLYFLGFETGDSSETTSLGGTASVQGTVKRTGSYALKINPTTSTLGYAQCPIAIGSDGLPLLNVATSAFYLRVYFQYTTKPVSAYEQILVVNANASSGKASNSVSVILTSAGKLDGYNGLTQIATGTTVLSSGVWYRLEVKVNVVSTTATYELKIDGVSEWNGTTTVIDNVLGPLILGKDRNFNSQSIVFYYDDVLISDSGYPGAGGCSVLVPTSNGTYTAWTGGFGDVDDLPSNGDTDKITTSTSGNASTFHMTTSATAGVSGTIHTVKSINISASSSIGSSIIGTRLRAGTTNSDTSAAISLTSYRSYQKIADSVPGGGSWTTTDLDGIECGVVAGSGVGGNVPKTTAIYAMVDYLQSSPSPTSTAPPHYLLPKINHSMFE